MVSLILQDGYSKADVNSSLTKSVRGEVGYELVLKNHFMQHYRTIMTLLHRVKFVHDVDKVYKNILETITNTAGLVGLKQNCNSRQCRTDILNSAFVVFLLVQQ